MESAERAADRLGNLVEQLMAAARLEHGPMSELVPLHLSEVTQVVATEFAVGAGASRLLVDIPPHLPAALGEPAIVHRILSNLIDNALKYSDADSVVTIEGREDAGKVVVSIRDHGPGISPVARPHNFERFYQGDSSATRSVGGVGLGLYICRRLAEEINGTVWLESSNGEGSILSLALEPSATRDMLRVS